SLSKSYGFASWRIGYMVIPNDLFLSVQKIQDTVVICPPVISQYAAMGALEAGSDYVRARIRPIAEVRETAGRELNRLSCLIGTARSDGAFYFLLRIRTEMDSMTLVERLIREYGVGVIPGS